jgi:hypothetical protein
MREASECGFPLRLHGGAERATGIRRIACQATAIADKFTHEQADRHRGDHFVVVLSFEVILPVRRVSLKTFFLRDR